MAGFDLTAASAYLKQFYGSARVESLILKSALWMVMPKDKSLEGEVFVHPVQHTTGAGVSADDSVAFAYTGAVGAKKWIITPTYLYAERQIRGEVIEQTKSSKGAFEQGVKVTTDAVYGAFGEVNSAMLWGTGSGTIGQVKSFSGTSCVLTNPEDAIKFKEGQILQASETDGGGSVRDSGASVTLTKVDYDTGTLTAGSNFSTISGFAIGDFLVEKGNYDAVFKGIPAWFPTYAARQAGVLSTLFLNVDRTVNPVRLAGHAMQATTSSKRTALERLGLKIAAFDQAPTHCFMSFTDYADLLEELSSNVQYTFSDLNSKTGQISFQSVKLAMAFGVITITPEKWCPVGSAWMLHMPSIKFYSIGDYPRVQMHDGLTLIRMEAANAYKYRITGGSVLYAGLAPWRSGVVTFAT